jgi:elongation factor Ts
MLEGGTDLHGSDSPVNSGDEQVAEISAKDVKALRDQTGAGMMDCKKALKDADGEVERATELLRERGLSKAGKRSGRATSEGAIGISIDGGFGVIVEVGCETDFVSKNDQFQDLVQRVADTIRDAGGASDPKAALAVKMGSGNVGDELTAAISRVGENIEVKRVESIEVDGMVGGYIHGGGKLGVLLGVRAGSQAALDGVVKDVAMHVAAADPTPLAVDQDGLDPALVDKEKSILRNQALQSGKPDNIVDNIVNGRLNKFFAENCLIEQPFVKDPDKKVGDILKEAGGAKVSEFVRYKLGEISE